MTELEVNCLIYRRDAMRTAAARLRIELNKVLSEQYSAINQLQVLCEHNKSKTIKSQSREDTLGCYMSPEHFEYCDLCEVQLRRWVGPL